ncbi:MAG: thioesterase [Desulfotignum sp.]|nr:thioesterase [Desulfotignum sp.]
MSCDPIFSQKMSLPYSVMGANNHVRMDRLLSLFQDAAGIHSHQMGVSSFDLAEKQLKWIISRYQIHVNHPMPWPGPYDLRTWRFPWKNLYEIRRFELISPDGALLVQALSVWVLVKAKNTRPVRLSPHMPPSLMAQTGPVPDLWPNDPTLSQWHHEKRFRIRIHDLDLNQHVNNTIYVTWALESLPMPWLFNHVPVTLVINFLKETFYPGAVVAKTFVSDQTDLITTCHGIYDESTSDKLAVLTLNWKSNGHVPVC